MDDKPVSTPPTSEKPVKEEPKVVEPEKKEEEEKPIEIPLENWRVSPLFYEVAGFLGIEEGDYEK